MNAKVILLNFFLALSLKSTNFFYQSIQNAFKVDFVISVVAQNVVGHPPKILLKRKQYDKCRLLSPSLADFSKTLVEVNAKSVMLHLRAHGNKTQGIQLSSKNIVPWSTLSETIKTSLKGKRLEKLIVIIDACFSGEFFPSDIEEIKWPNYFSDLAENLVFISSCSENELARGFKNHSVFSNALDQSILSMPKSQFTYFQEILDENMIRNSVDLYDICDKRQVEEIIREQGLKQNPFVVSCHRPFENENKEQFIFKGALNLQETPASLTICNIEGKQIASSDKIVVSPVMRRKYSWFSEFSFGGLKHIIPDDGDIRFFTLDFGRKIIRGKFYNKSGNPLRHDVMEPFNEALTKEAFLKY